MTAQHFRPKPGIRDICIFIVVPIVFINHFLNEFDYEPWALATAIMLSVLFVVLYFGSKVELTVDETGIRQRLVYPLFSRLDRRSTFSVGYVDLRLIESLGKHDTVYILIITMNNGDIHNITLSNYTDLPSIISSIQRFYIFDATPVLPIGQAFLYLPKKTGHILLFSTVLHAIAFMMIDFLSYWHPSHTGFTLLMVKLSPLTFLMVYLYTRSEWKQGAGKVFFFIAVVMCSAIAWNIIAFNRYCTELYGKPKQQQFLLLEKGEKSQTWYKLHDISARRNPVYLRPWSKVDYQPDLEPGYVYVINIKQGHLNDWVFVPDAFKKAKQLQKANLKQFSEF